MISSLSSTLFGEKPPPKQSPKEALASTKKNLKKPARDIERELRVLDRQEVKLQNDIKKLAGEGQTNSAKIMAKELIRVRQQRENLLKTKLTLAQVKSKTETASANLAVTNAMSGATKAMKTMNSINSAEKMNSTFSEFEKQKMIMDMQEDLLDELLEDSSVSEEVDEVIDEVLDDINLELNSQLAKTTLVEKQKVGESNATSDASAKIQQQSKTAI